MKMVKLGKHQTCWKKLVRFGISEELAKLVCSKYLTKDDEWEIKEEEKKKTGFEPPEKIKEEKEKKEKPTERVRMTPAGGKAVRKEKEKARPIASEPRAFQLPLFQPWRAPKSQHRLQTKLEKLQTAEQKFLTMEQLMKRTEYAIAIKKRDSGDLEIVIPELVLDSINGQIIDEIIKKFIQDNE
jgi:hypothetical protein